MGTTICVIGAGELGGAVAHALARGRHAGTIVLFDATAGIAAGKALDIQQAGAIEASHARLYGTDDLSRVSGAAAYVVADRAEAGAGEWAGEAGLALLRRLDADIGRAPLVFAGAAQEALLLAAAREARIAPERLIGSAPDALASAVRSLVALDARCSPQEVALTVLGAPPAGYVVLWSEATIAGYALERVLTAAQLARLEARVPRLWPPGPHALGAAAARAAGAVLTSSRRTFSVLSVLGGEFGVRGRVGALPTFLAASGIVHRRVPTLNTRERVQIETALGG